MSSAPKSPSKSKAVRLATLVDRDGRQLPIAAQFVGATLSLKPGQSIGLKRDAKGRLELELRAAKS